MRRNMAIAAAALIALAAPAAAQNFQGAYLGFDIGSTSNKTQIEHSINKPNIGNNGQNHVQTIAGVSALSGNLDSNSAIYGAAGGYDWRFSTFVVGAQLDMDYWGVNDSRTARITVPTNNNTFRTITAIDTAQASYMMAIRPRAGMVIGESTLIYASAGLVRSDLRYSNSTTITGNNGSSIAGSYQASTTQRNGTTIGLGAERMLSAKMGVRLDYQHVAFKRSDVTSQGLLLPANNDLAGSSINNSFKTSADILKIGLNWRFD